MVRLVDDYEANARLFADANIRVPSYSQSAISAAMLVHPRWVHFGGGNLFRAFHSVIAQRLIEQGDLDSGVVVVETYDGEIIDAMYRPFKNRFLAVTMKADGTLSRELVASVADSIYVTPTANSGSRDAEWERLTKVFENPSLQLVTISITEKGYSLHRVQTDIETDPNTQKPQTNMGMFAYLLLKRYRAGRFPIAMVSTDNFSQNGQRLHDALMALARGWHENGRVEQGFIDYIDDSRTVSFPWTMIDRITPVPSQSVAERLMCEGFEDVGILRTKKQTVIAPFANTEESHYLVVEDSFPNGRPPLEKAGVILTDRQTVNSADQMKVTACLNPLHTALAVFGCLLGFTSIADEMHDPDLLGLITNLGLGENLPVVADPGIINPKDFIDELLTKRLPNRNIPDTPQRIATDSSQKIPIRFGVTVGRYLADPRFDVTSLEFIPLVFAGWCRYLLGVDDSLQPFAPSPDPMLDELQAALKGVVIGDSSRVHETLKPILGNHEIFPHDLYEAGLAGKVEDYFIQMLSGRGAVRSTVHAALEEHGKEF